MEPLADKGSGKAQAGGIGCWGFGSALAIAISWSMYESLLWAIVHAFFTRAS